MWQEEMICPKSHIHQWQSYKSWSPDLRIFTLSPSTCPKFEPGLGELVLSQPQWVWGSWSFIWFLSSGVWPGACHLCCWSFCEQSLALHSLWAWHLWHLASWTLKRLSSLNMLWGLVQDELGWEAVNGGSGAALLCPSLPGVTQSGSQCQEMWHWHQLTLVDVFIRTWSSGLRGTHRSLLTRYSSWASDLSQRWGLSLLFQGWLWFRNLNKDNNNNSNNWFSLVIRKGIG